MKTIYSLALFSLIGLLDVSTGLAQCGAPTNLGSSANLFTLIRNSTNPVAVDKNLNTVIYVHRNNNTNFGGSSGNLRYDVSFNAGTTWTLNQGVLNNLNSSYGRYPNVAIYNPTNNVTPSNAYLGYLAATINTASSAWNGVVTGVSQLNGTGITENYNQPVVAPQLIAHSLVKGAPGIFWAVDALYNGSAITGFAIYKGTWNSGSNDIVWANNFTVAPSFNTAYSSAAYIGDYNIAFDPSGTNGWMSFLGHVTPGPSAYAYYPVFYKTTNGGATWTGPIQVNLGTLGCLTSNMTGTNVPTTSFEHDLTVDANGNPHLFTTICNGTNAYSVLYTAWHHMYDITLRNGLWVANDVGNVMAGRGQWGTSPNITTQDMAPQVSRSQDGTKIFFSWTDNSTYTLGQANQSPNLFTRGYNVTNNTWTPIKDFSSCNTGAAGLILSPHVAAEVLEPSTGVFKIAPVYGVLTNNDPALVCDFKFLDNGTFSTSDFSVTMTSTTNISIAQGTNVLLCPGSTITINTSSTVGQALWSTGSTNTAISISSSSISTYSVLAQQNCAIGSASISVTNMSVSVSGPSASMCPGSSASLSISGNAIGYNWNPGAVSGSAALVSPTVTTIYTVVANSNANCSISNTVSVGVFNLPTVTIAGNATVCAGSAVTLTASGASTFTWTNGPTTNVYTFTPTLQYNTYSVTGTDVNTCVNSQTFNVQVMPVPTVSALSSKTLICDGEVVLLTALGATTYSWSTGSTAGNINVSPSVTTVYTLTGYDVNLCSDKKTIAVNVSPTPTVIITSNRPVLCVGEKAILTATGASTYFWSNASTNVTVQISATSTAALSYTATGTSTFGCVGKGTFTQTVSACTGISNVSLSGKLLIYPNPSQGQFQVVAEGGGALQLINQLGQVLRTYTISDQRLSVSMDISDLPSGVYYLSGQLSDGMVREKLVLQK
jgi:hypothetical protein